jgi:glycosyltransferase involved in cell wall biosynthesis
LKQPRVSAICITDHRIDFLQRSAECFLQQHYPNKELVVVFPENDDETGDYLASLNSSEIRMIPIDPSDPISLGEKRNLAIQMSDGFYFCTWDDDDWFHTDRIASQVAHIQKTGKRSSTISNVLVYDTVQMEAYLSFRRPWEQTLLCEKSVMNDGVQYGNVNRGEDSVLISALKQNDWVDALFEPHLYVYIFHGHNTWHRQHWEQNIFRPGKKLSPEFSAQLGEIITQDIAAGSKALHALWDRQYK